MESRCGTNLDSYWKYNFLEGCDDGDEVVTGVFLKKCGTNHFATFTAGGELLAIMPHDEDGKWWQNVSLWRAADYRWSQVAKLLPDDKSKIKRVLSLSPCLMELNEFSSMTELEYNVSDAHGVYLDTLIGHFSSRMSAPAKFRLINLGAHNLNKAGADGLWDTKKKYDLILCIMVLNYVESYEDVLPNISSSLSRNGFAIIAVHVTSLQRLPHTGRLLSWNSQVGMHCSTRGEHWEWTEERFVHDCKAAGMCVIEKIRISSSLFLKLRAS